MKALQLLPCILILAGCTHIGQSEVERPYSVSMPVKDSFQVKFPPRIKLAFGVHLISHNSGNLLISMGENGLIQLFNTTTGTSRLSPLPGISPMGNFTGTSWKDKIFVVDLDSFLLTEFELDDTAGLILRERFELKGVLDTTMNYIRFQQHRTIEVIWPYLYISIGSNSNEKNHLDKFAFLQVNLEQPTLPGRKICRYQEEYLSRDLDHHDTFLKPIGTGDLFFASVSSDSIFVYEESGVLKHAGLLNSNKGYRKFDKARSRDLGYLRKHTVTNEVNLSVCAFGKNRIAILKKLRKDKITHPDKFDLYVVNSNLEVLAKYRIKHSVSPFICFSYLDGFLIFNEDLDKAYYYEIPG